MSIGGIMCSQTCFGFVTRIDMVGSFNTSGLKKNPKRKVNSSPSMSTYSYS